MHFNVLNRRFHHWAAFTVALPILVIIASGILLQMKKRWDWVQPPEIRGTGTVPVIGFEQIMATLQATPSLAVAGWDDVSRIDVRADRGLAKVTIVSGWEAQIDLGTGELLQTAYRRSDVIESIHDGSFFAGDWTKLGIFLPAGLTLLLLWLTGLWMWWVQFIGKRRHRAARRRKAAAVVLLAIGLPALGFAQTRLAVQPIAASGLVQDPGRGAGEIVGDGVGTPASPWCAFVRRAIAGADQHRLRPGRPAGRDVLPAIPHRERAREVQIQVGGGAVNEARPGFAAVAHLPQQLDRGLGMMRAEIEGVDPCAAGGEAVLNVPVGLRWKALGHDTAAHTGLVGDHHDGESAEIQLTHGIDGEGEEHQPIEVVQVPGFFDQRAVTIHEHCASAHGRSLPQPSGAPPSFRLGWLH